MRTAKVTRVERRSHMHRQSPGAGDVILIVTDLPAGEMNSFYIDVKDKSGMPLAIASDPDLHQVHATQIMKEGDIVIYDKQSFLQKQVIWNGRKFRQRDYSFDIYSRSLYTG